MQHKHPALESISNLKLDAVKTDTLLNTKGFKVKKYHVNIFNIFNEEDRKKYEKLYVELIDSLTKKRIMILNLVKSFNNEKSAYIIIIEWADIETNLDTKDE